MRTPGTTQAALRKENGLVIGVELRGLEPLTPTLPVWCATSCATAPWPTRCLQRADGNDTGPGSRGGGGVGRADTAPTPPSCGSAQLHLRDPQVVAEGVAEAEVDAVGLVDRLLGDLDALGLELRVRLVGVIGAEEQVSPGRPLGDQLAHLGSRLVAHRRRSRLLQQDRPVRLVRQG